MALLTGIFKVLNQHPDATYVLGQVGKGSSRPRGHDHSSQRNRGEGSIPVIG